MSEHQKTAMFDDMPWLAPAETVDDLPTRSVGEGSVCYVKSESAVYRYTCGVWVLDASVGRPPPRQRGA